MSDDSVIRKIHIDEIAIAISYAPYTVNDEVIIEYFENLKIPNKYIECITCDVTDIKQINEDEKEVIIRYFFADTDVEDLFNYIDEITDYFEYMICTDIQLDDGTEIVITNAKHTCRDRDE
jgi:predicted HAD superfamily phosphohydrolase